MVLHILLAVAIILLEKEQKFTRNVNSRIASTIRSTLTRFLVKVHNCRLSPQPLYDSDGNEVGTGMFLKYKIKNDVTNDLKIASEDSGADAFMNLYKKDRDFYNFVTDSARMKGAFVDDKYKFKGYRESREVLEKLQDKNYKPTADELQKAYRMFNNVIPSDGAGNARLGKDVATQRAKFFNELKKNGYGAVLDTNDAIYGGFKATSPVIVFDMDSVALAGAERTTMQSKKFSKVALAGRKALGI